jgi:hypothetical protein
MGKMVLAEWMSLNAVAQAPAYPDEDVENGLAAPSQGRMRPPWPDNSKETQHDDPADGQRPHRCRRP